MNLDPFGLRQKVLDFIADVVDIVRADPIGEMTMDEAAALISEGGTDKVTVAAAERAFGLARLISESNSSITKALPTEARMITDPSQIPEGYGELPADHPQVQEMAKRLGIDPSTIRAFGPKSEDDEMVMTANGPIRRKDIPTGPDGQPDPAWVDENCNCPEHQARRQQKVTAHEGRGNGPYL